MEIHNSPAENSTKNVDQVCYILLYFINKCRQLRKEGFKFFANTSQLSYMKKKTVWVFFLLNENHCLELFLHTLTYISYQLKLF